MEIPKRNKKEFLRQHAHQIVFDRIVRGGYTYNQLDADEKQAFQILIDSYDYDRFEKH